VDAFIPADHPLRRIGVMVNEALAKLDELFSRMYEADIKGGRPSIALLRAMLFSIHPERKVMEQTQNNMLFRWYIGLGDGRRVWVPTVFSKNRQRLIDALHRMKVTPHVAQNKAGRR
jgi:transposase